MSRFEARRRPAHFIVTWCLDCASRRGGTLRALPQNHSRRGRRENAARGTVNGSHSGSQDAEYYGGNLAWHDIHEMKLDTYRRSPPGIKVDAVIRSEPMFQYLAQYQRTGHKYGSTHSWKPRPINTTPKGLTSRNIKTHQPYHYSILILQKEYDMITTLKTYLYFYEKL